MTVKELARLIAADINRSTKSVVATVSAEGKLVLTATSPGTNIGLYSSAILNSSSTSYASSLFSGGTPDVGGVRLIGNEGDTFFQRWDSVKAYPADKNDENQILDIASVMIESHINLDGRTDLDRGTTRLADIDYMNLGSINKVYSQEDNFRTGIDTDESFNLDTYRSSITWTLPKSAGSDVDEWTHITLGSSLSLDGDKGSVQALRRFQNSIIAFQDKGIAEILFNSRTQLSTQDGVPVEIANSGKVDGKRYITNKYGTVNKWSIVEGKSGLYFIDNINKVLGRFGANGIESLSTKNGFDAWIRDNHSTESWTPASENKNFVSYYDRIHSDVYFIGENSAQPCLVFNELLDSFTGFFDYDDVTMMTNIEDKFVSFKSGFMWLQNEGYYGEFFGTAKPFSFTWRVAPDNVTDKIWESVEYKADFISVLDANGDGNVSENDLIGGQNAEYDPTKTFEKITVWNEYQTTGEQSVSELIKDEYPDVRKKFRTWRLDIPRAQADGENNPFGLDRIRNPWVMIKLEKGAEANNRKIMQLHDMIIKYYGE